MIRSLSLPLAGFVAATLLCCAAAGVQAQSSDKSKTAKTAQKTSAQKASTQEDKGKSAKSSSSKAESKKESKKKEAEAKPSAKPVQVGNFGDWGAFVAKAGKDKTCYALASPKDRLPAGLPRDTAYVFISSRPAENVRNEVSVIMGFAMKDGSEAKAEIGNSNFELVAKGSNAWIKNPAEENQFIEALKKSGKLVVKAPSIKGNVTTDSYSLTGFSQAVERVMKECS